ncbi:MAG: PAS domain-containing protein, partial [Gemmatimonadota bacterium]|nr:PAS domain-containing protein [Gemmatimonadota bacterium]
MSSPTDSQPPAGDDRLGSETGAAPSERPPRLSRPTPSHLFAQRSEGEGNGGRRRPTRVIPELAAQVDATGIQSTSPATDSAVPEPVGGTAAPAPAERAPEAPATIAAESASPRHAPVAESTPSGHAPEFPPDLVFIVRPGGTILYVNRPLGRRTEEEVVGSLFTDWVFPEQHAAVREALARVFGTGQADGVDLHGIQGHSPEAWFECRIAPNVRDGKVVSVTIIGRDVTRYKEIERGLRERHAEVARALEDRTADLDLLRAQSAPGESGTRADEETMRFRAALETAGEAIFLVDPEQEVLVDLNDTACRWLRRHRADLLGKAVASLDLEFPLLPPASFDASFTETRDSRRPLTLEG